VRAHPTRNPPSTAAQRFVADMPASTGIPTLQQQSLQRRMSRHHCPRIEGIWPSILRRKQGCSISRHNCHAYAMSEPALITHGGKLRWRYLASYLCRGNCFGSCNGFGDEGAPAPCNAYSTGSFALYPSRAITEYFTGLCFSSCIFSGLPSLST